MPAELETNKELLRVTPSEAANMVLDDILSDPEKELRARRALKETETEISDAFRPSFLIGNIVCNAVYGTIDTGIAEMAKSFIEKVYKPLGFMPKSDYDQDLEIYDDASEEFHTATDPGNMLIELAALVLGAFRGSYTHNDAKAAVREAKIRASTPGNSFPAYTPGEEQSILPGMQLSSSVDVSSHEKVIRPTPTKMPQGDM
jgi:hypothetical protein